MAPPHFTPTDSASGCSRTLPQLGRRAAVAAVNRQIGSCHRRRGSLLNSNANIEEDAPISILNNKFEYLFRS